MSCDIPICDGVRKASDCKCYSAVMRAYQTMSNDNIPETVAQEVALRVYRHHHPEDSPDNAALTVQSWISAGENIH